jgi:hypothetical protein
MKKNFAIILISLFSLNLFAANETEYSARHLAKINQSIAQKCALKGKFVQVSSVVEEIRVDQGIVDLKFQTIFKHRDWIDQGVFDDYSIEVISHYTDMYDLADGEWGEYYVSSVECIMLN